MESQLVAFRGTPRLTAGHLVDEATVTGLPSASAKGTSSTLFDLPRPEPNSRPGR